VGLTVLSLSLGIVGAARFVVTFSIDGATRLGYYPTHHTISARVCVCIV
jgi:hypothetical protein